MIYIQRKEHIANGILTLGIIHFVLFLLCNYFSVETKACPELQLSQVMEYSTEKILEENCFSLQLGWALQLGLGRVVYLKFILDFLRHSVMPFSLFVLSLLTIPSWPWAVCSLHKVTISSLEFKEIESYASQPADWQIDVKLS